MRLHACLTFCAAAAAMACGHDITTPAMHPTHGISVVSGAGVSDTIDSYLPEPLLVRVTDANGTPLAGAIVQFTAVNALGIAVGNASGGYGDQQLADSADASGIARAYITFRSIAGPQKVAIHVPIIGVSDTASYTITPGNKAGVRAAPADTALIQSHSFTLRTHAVDRAGNPRADPVTYAVGTPDVTVSAQGSVTGVNFARTFIVATSGSFVDTTRLSVVPAGQLAAFKYHAISYDTTAVAVFATDGSNYHEYFGATTYWNHVGPAWSPSGSQIVFENGGNGVGGEKLMTLDVSSTGLSNLHQVIPNGSDSVTSESYPQYSRDGTWIYFTGAEAAAYGSTEIWRVHPDGTGAAKVGLSATEYYSEYESSPSPDGTQLVYGTTNSSGSALFVRTLSTGTTVPLGVPDGSGPNPRWSPSGNVIAYIDNGAVIATIHADGTGYRVVSLPGHTYRGNLDWSPDGQWIVAGSPLEIINVQTGLTLPLPYSVNLRLTDPSWHP